MQKKYSLTFIMQTGLLLLAFVFMNSCKKENVHFLYQMNLSPYCLTETTNNFGYPKSYIINTADIAAAFNSAGYYFYTNRIVSATFKSYKVAVATDSLTLKDINGISALIRKINDTGLGNQIGYCNPTDTLATSTSLQMTGGDINGIFSYEQFQMLVLTYNQTYGNRAICLQPYDVVLDFELKADAKK